MGSSPHTGLLHRQISPLFACPPFFQSYTFFWVRGQKVTYVDECCEINNVILSASTQNTSQYLVLPQYFLRTQLSVAFFSAFALKDSETVKCL